jgi:hypothetical protein
VILVERMIDSKDCLKSSGGLAGLVGLIDDRRRLVNHQYTATPIEPHAITRVAVVARAGMD